MAKKLIKDPRRPQLFSNEQLGLPPDDYEYREIVKTDEHGRKIRQRITVKTKDAFVRQAREIWGDQYDYSESVYTDNKSPITIRCKKHDHYFTVPMAQNHVIKQHGNVRPTGCDLCMAEEIGYYPNNRGPHHFRTDEEKQREREEKARRHHHTRSDRANPSAATSSDYSCVRTVPYLYIIYRDYSPDLNVISATSGLPQWGQTAVPLP